MIRYFVGVPGSGKTTIAVKILRKNIKYELKLRKRSYLYRFFHKSLHKYCFANYETSLANYVDLSILADQRLPDYSYLSMDESGLEFNSRSFASLKLGIIEYFKKHRHHHTDIDMFSQTWDDTDKQIRDLAEEIWVIRKLGPISFARCVFKRVGIDESTKKLEYQHYWRSVLWQLLPFMPKQFIFCFRPLYYKYFDSFSPLLRNVYLPDGTFDVFNTPKDPIKSIH